jgi:lipopolysaccharide/colanic/teichoic acid biosynthesis glycosyltransferase
MKTEADVPRSLHTLYSPPQMRALMQRERMRVDRGGDGGVMSVVILEMSPRATRRQWQRLARLVNRRCRFTDEIGWVGEHQLGLVLPGTPAFGAYCLADSIRTSAAEHDLAVRHRIYAYPGDDIDASGGDDGGSPGNGKRRPIFVDLSAAPANGGGGGGGDRRGLVGVADREAEVEGGVQPLRPLVQRDLPPWKRAMDVLGAMVGIVGFAPVMILAAVLIRLTSRGPAVFKQRRHGLGGRQFTIYKFRTMVQNAEELKDSLRPISEQDGPAFKLANDPRVTWVGKLLRATSLDELPQFFNVLKGDMSLVGPRPLPLDESDGCDRWQRRRLDVTPGLTCIWQVHGRSTVTFDEWMRMDMQYIKSRSFWQDVKILALTLPAVLLRRGAR